MASVTTDLRLLSQLQSITADWPVPNYTAWWQRHMGVTNLPRVATRQCDGRDPTDVSRSWVQWPNHYVPDWGSDDEPISRESSGKPNLVGDRSVNPACDH